jgi:ribosomal subunit interface protein
MQIAVNGKQFQISDSLRGHIETSIRQAAEKYFSNPIDATMTMSRDGADVRADISAHVGRRIMIQGQAKTADAYAAFDAAAAKIDKRLRRFKRRLRDHDRQAPAVETDGVEAQEIVFAGETDAPVQGGTSNDVASDGAIADDAEWQPVVVAEMATRINSLTVESAVMHVELSDAPVLMFRNASHGEINVVFRRDDGNIGWIDPKSSS